VRRLSLTLAARNDLLSSLNPEWDEIVYVPVHTLKDRLVLEVMDYQQQSKDRSLGTCDLLVSSLAQEGPDKINKPYEATGKVEGNGMLQSDGKKTIKGTLFYEASFSPCYPMPDISFEAPPTPAQVAKNDGDETDDDAATIRTHESTHEADEPVYHMVEDAQRLQQDALATAEAGTPVSALSNGTALTDGSSSSAASPADATNKPRKLSRQELLKAQAGVLAINIIGGKLSKRARLEILMDSGYWPSCACHAFAGADFVDRASRHH
jgi:Ca2+-dependent lipid-binding protein